MVAGAKAHEESPSITEQGAGEIPVKVTLRKVQQKTYRRIDLSMARLKWRV